MPTSRQPHRELGEVADFAVDRDRAAVLLGDGLITYRQAKSRTFAGRLGREEGLEEFLAVLMRNANAVVTDPDLDAFAELAGRDLQCGPESTVAALAAALGNSIEGVTYEVQKHPAHILRHNLDRCELAVEVELPRDLEILILRAGAVIGKVQALLDKRVQIGRLPVDAAAARVLQHAPDNAVGAATVFGDPFEVACQHSDCLENLGAFAGVQHADRLGRCFLQLLQQLDRKTGEVVDKIEWILDLVRDAGG